MTSAAEAESAHARLRASWEANAAAWAAVVRGGTIPSRRAGTDEAILAACRRLGPRRVLDVGCGEGWLTRALAQEAEIALGIDGSAPLIEKARAAGGAVFELLDYETLAHDVTRAAGPWDVIVCNFALLDDHVEPLLGALRTRLGSSGRVLIQTVHPWAESSSGYADGWREETFAGFDVAFGAPMPWYFRTLNTWVRELTGAGLSIASLEEPRHRETGQPLSLLLECVAGYSR